MEEVEQGFHQSMDPQNLVSKAKHRANPKETLGCIQGSAPSIQKAQGLILGNIGEAMFQGWFTPYHESVWSEAIVQEKIKTLAGYQPE